MTHVAPPQYSKVLELARAAVEMPKERKPIIVGLDGRDGAGKSSLASWLAWQLEMPAIHLDIFIVRDSEPLRWRTDDLKRAIDTRVSLEKRPVIVEGMLLLDALEQVGYSPGFLVFVEKEGNDGSHHLGKHIKPYFARQKPREKAHHVMTWAGDDAAD